MKRIVFALALLIGSSSCSSCESCGGTQSASDASAEVAADAGPVATTLAPPATTPSPPATSAPPVDPRSACRLVARALTAKACDCPQKKDGCCFFGASPNGDAPYIECSKGKTDWPAALETRLCKVAEDPAKADAFRSCLAAKDKLQCGKTAAGDLGAVAPKECSALFVK